MTTETNATDRLREQLGARRRKLQELESRLAALPGAIDEQRAALGRALADSLPHEAVQEIRQALAAMESDRIGLDAAIQQVSADVGSLEEEWKPLHVAALESEAVRLRDAHTADLREGLGIRATTRFCKVMICKGLSPIFLPPNPF